MEASISTTPVLWLAFAVAASTFGAIGQKTRLLHHGCGVGIVEHGRLERMRMWLLAIGVAILGAGAHGMR